MSDKMISTHLVGTGSDLQCCNDGEWLAEIFPPALESYLGNESYYKTKVKLLERMKKASWHRAV